MYAGTKLRHSYGYLMRSIKDWDRLKRVLYVFSDLPVAVSDFLRKHWDISECFIYSSCWRSYASPPQDILHIKDTFWFFGGDVEIAISLSFHWIAFFSFCWTYWEQPSFEGEPSVMLLGRGKLCFSPSRQGQFAKNMGLTITFGNCLWW